MNLFELFAGESMELLILGLLLVLIAVLVRQAFRQRRRRAERIEDEDQSLRQVLEHLEKMDRRISNLETVLMDRQEQKKDRGKN
jgi:flagellar biosynthesis/type III secretory pathway M-ring protein FliF/YscJ